MDAILSSFCFLNSDLENINIGAFHRMPPACFESSINEFVPEYSSLFLCDSFYVDAASVKRISENPYFAKHRMVLDALEMSGRLKIKDFTAVVSPYQEVIDTSIEHDMQNLDEWVGPFSELVSIWERYKEQVELHVKMKDYKYYCSREYDRFFNADKLLSFRDRPTERNIFDAMIGDGMYIV